MPTTPLTPAKRRVLDLLKRLGAVRASELARRLGLTDVAVRQHLAALEHRGLVEQTPTPPEGRGRPSSAWSLTETAHGLFPDRHGDLTVSLIQATRRALGQQGLDRVIAQRGREQLRDYRTLLPGPSATLKKRVEALARQRSAEGYMPEVRKERKQRGNAAASCWHVRRLLIEAAWHDRYRPAIGTTLRQRRQGQPCVSSPSPTALNSGSVVDSAA